MAFKERRVRNLARQHGLLVAGERIIDGEVGDIGDLFVDAVRQSFGRSTAMLAVTDRRVLLAGKDIDFAVDLITVWVSSSRTNTARPSCHG